MFLAVSLNVLLSSLRLFWASVAVYCNAVKCHAASISRMLEKAWNQGLNLQDFFLARYIAFALSERVRIDHASDLQWWIQRKLRLTVNAKKLRKQQHNAAVQVAKMHNR